MSTSKTLLTRALTPHIHFTAAASASKQRAPRGVALCTGQSRPHQPLNFLIYLLVVAALLLLAFLPRAAAADKHSASADSAMRGEYLTAILGCAGCHTEGALEGLPYGRPLAGSKIGIAYSTFDPIKPPAVVFASNLTSHKIFGLGKWSKRQITRAIRNGVNHAGGEVITVMPWMNYARLYKQDVDDIASYLQSLPPENYEIPDPTVVGEVSTYPYVRIGVYHFTPTNSD